MEKVISSVLKDILEENRSRLNTAYNRAKHTCMALDEDTYFAYLFDPEQKKFDIARMGEEPGPNGLWMHEYGLGFFHGGRGWNPSGYDNPEFDEIWDKLITETDVKKRQEMIYEMQHIINRDLPFGHLLGTRQVDVIRSDRVKDYVVTMGGLSNWINLWTFFNAKPVVK